MSDKWASRQRRAYGTRNQAAYPIHTAAGLPAWQGVIVIEPADYLWRCPHAHLKHEDAVRCAEEHEERVAVEVSP